MVNNNGNPPDGGAPPTPPAPKKDAPQGYVYGSRGAYASSNPDHKTTARGLRFGDRVEFTDAEFKRLTKTLRERLVPEADWPAHVESLKRDGQLRADAVVPGAK